MAHYFRYFSVVLITFMSYWVSAQKGIVINLAPIDGVSISPDNILNYQVQCANGGSVQINGRIRYRNSDLYLFYTFSYTLRAGTNIIAADQVHPKWEFSSPALQSLFFNYKVLPTGTYEYCVTVVPSTTIKESVTANFEECLFHRADDFFLINLIDPSNKEKLKEYYPPLSWVANYSFSNELTYRIRVAPMKQGQNAMNAVMRNQAIFDENNLSQNSIVYPVYATPLVANQWYAWMVDAYYHGILLGSSEAWQFIIPDTLDPAKKGNRSYIDIKRESGLNKLSALGELKLKYLLDNAQTDSLYLEINDENGKKRPLDANKLKAVFGDNRYELDLVNGSNLKHLKKYTMIIKTKSGHEYRLTFQYINPDFQH